MPRAPIYILSGATGATAGHVLHTALAQFQDVDVPVELIPRIRQREQVETTVARAARSGATIVHTLTDPEVRATLTAVAEESQVPTIDLMGPVLDRLTQIVGEQPMAQPGRYRLLHAASYARADAIEYAIAHDDGCRPGGWSRADIVLIGVSRVGKTPVSVYLAVLGVLVANVSLVHGIEPPTELLSLDPRRVIGLTITPDQLALHRRGRQDRLHVPLGQSYTDIVALEEEVAWARQFFRRNRFRVVDTTNKPIEHIAGDILKMIPHSEKQPGT
jgi:[pyruvate, water dikinase]-phosphate phosphotransferase / [pyruvate, water dikinase] kinase